MEKRIVKDTVLKNIKLNSDLEKMGVEKDGKTLLDTPYNVAYIWGGQVCCETFDSPVVFLVDGGNA